MGLLDIRPIWPSISSESLPYIRTAQPRTAQGVLCVPLVVLGSLHRLLGDERPVLKTAAGVPPLERAVLRRSELALLPTCPRLRAYRYVQVEALPRQTVLPLVESELVREVEGAPLAGKTCPPWPPMESSPGLHLHREWPCPPLGGADPPKQKQPLFYWEGQGQPVIWPVWPYHQNGMACAQRTRGVLERPDCIYATKRTCA
jgi:hypothetical protein